MSSTFDVIVIGVGGVGSATLAHLARKGVRVLGLEQFGVAHDRGSSHGQTRIIRKAYFEHPDYVPLLHRAYELWRELEADTGRTLYTETGLILYGPRAVAGAREAARLHELPLEVLSLSEATLRFPLFRFQPDAESSESDDARVAFEREAGFLRVEDCVAAHVDVAQRAGGQLHWDEPVHQWRETSDGVEVSTSQGRYTAETIVITAGAWADRLLPDLGVQLSVLRKVQLWHGIESTDWRSAPVFYFEEPGGGEFYGLPSLDGCTIKIAEHSGGEPVDDPGAVDRSLRQDDAAAMAGFVRRRLRCVTSTPLRHAVCLYTLSPDRHFVIGRHPRFSRVLLTAGLSGHGFKFTSVIGEALADLCCAGSTSLPIGFLSPERPELHGVTSAVR